MFLSLLEIDVGDNPDRPRPGRTWLRNLYRVHQRLCMAFPSRERKLDDPDFLKPFRSEDFRGAEAKQVHVQRGADSGFLFRVDPQRGGGVALLVQSAAEPDWDYAFHNAPCLLAAPPSVRAFEPCFTEEERFRFRLVANPTRKIDTKSGPDERRRNGTRVPLPDDRLGQWLAGKSEKAGFSFVEKSLLIEPGYIYVNKDRNERGERLRWVRYEGALTVTDPEKLREAIFQGIGPAKAFGFGLLSLARLRS